MNNAVKLGLVGLGTATFVASTILFLRRQLKVETLPEEGAQALDEGDTDASSEADEATERETSPRDESLGQLADDVEWSGALPLPTAEDVEGDLENNWGSTPVDLRPLFLYMEEQSGIPGAGRIFSVIAYGESRWVTTAHNGNGDDERDEVERAASRRAYDRYKPSRQPLRFGEQAADFGSGGLFGALAPFFLWTGVNEVKSNAPLLNADTRAMFLPRVAGFAACVYLMRLLRYYQIDDVFDIKVGWASPSLLVGEKRSSATTKAVRSKFSTHATTVGIDLWDSATVPAVLTVEAFPGVLELFEAMVGELPTPIERTS